eukprot:IDg8923t1
MCFLLIPPETVTSFSYFAVITTLPSTTLKSPGLRNQLLSCQTMLKRHLLLRSPSSTSLNVSRQASHGISGDLFGGGLWTVPLVSP